MGAGGGGGGGEMKGLPIILCFELYYQSGLLTFRLRSHGCSQDFRVLGAPIRRIQCDISALYRLLTEKFTPVTSFACMEICCALGHSSFPSHLAVRRLWCFLWSKESKAKLSDCQSPVVLNVKSSCYFTVIMFLC